MADSVHDGPRMNALIHRAVRRDLAGFAGALDRFPAGDRTRAAALAARFHWLDVHLGLSPGDCRSSPPGTVPA